MGREASRRNGKGESKGSTNKKNSDTVCIRKRIRKSKRKSMTYSDIMK